MSIAELVEQARTLSIQERKQLVKALIDTLDAPEVKPHRITELRGLGKEIWSGVDAQQYVDQLRDEWDQPR